MRNLEPNEYRSLVESYEAVYDQDLRNKLEEEKEIAEFCEFVNSLIDEGYDLSECSEEDLYEYYITEAGKGKVVGDILKAIGTYGAKGLRQAWNIPAGQSIRKEVGKRATQSAARAAGSVAKGAYEIPKTAVKTVGGFVGQIAKQPIVAVPLTAAGLESLRGEKSLVRQAVKGKFPQVSTPTAKPKPNDPFSNVPPSLREDSTDWSSIPGKDWATLTRGSERKIYVPGVGWQFPATINKELVKRGKPSIKDPGQPTRTSRPSERPAQSQPAAETPRNVPATTPEPAKPTPATTRTPEPPKTAPQAPTRPSTPTRPAKPPSAPKPSLQTGDRNKDLATWAQSNKVMIQKVGTPQQREILSAVEKGQPIPAARPLSKDVEDLKTMQKASQERQKVQPGVKESYDAFDLVLEYLLSQGHVDTLDEALYVMMEMSSETIQSIVEQSGSGSPMDSNPGTGIPPLPPIPSSKPKRNNTLPGSNSPMDSNPGTGIPPLPPIPPIPSSQSSKPKRNNTLPGSGRPMDSNPGTRIPPLPPLPQ